MARLGDARTTSRKKAIHSAGEPERDPREADQAAVGRRRDVRTTGAAPARAFTLDARAAPIGERAATTLLTAFERYLAAWRVRRATGVPLVLSWIDLASALRPCQASNERRCAR